MSAAASVTCEAANLLGWYVGGASGIGVWDTVGALGIPGTRICVQSFAFHETQLGPRVRHAFQALAIDERRDIARRQCVMSAVAQFGEALIAFAVTPYGLTTLAALRDWSAGFRRALHRRRHRDPAAEPSSARSGDGARGLILRAILAAHPPAGTPPLPAQP
jgi:hypothetical protein